MLSAKLDTYLQTLRDRSSGIAAIWLFGSRANGTACPESDPESDWDLWVFGDQQTLSELRSAKELNREEFDVMVVYDGNRFESPWKKKSGSLKGWEWRRVSDKTAEYVGTKPRNNDGFAVERLQLKANRLWP